MGRTRDGPTPAAGDTPGADLSEERTHAEGGDLGSSTPASASTSGTSVTVAAPACTPVAVRTSATSACRSATARRPVAAASVPSDRVAGCSSISRVQPDPSATSTASASVPGTCSAAARCGERSRPASSQGSGCGGCRAGARPGGRPRVIASTRRRRSSRWRSGSACGNDHGRGRQRCRAGEVVALTPRDPELTKRGELFAAFDAFGDETGADIPCEGHKGGC